MEEKNEFAFLCGHMRKLRESNELTQEELAQKLNVNKSVISRAEAGKAQKKTIRHYAERYCEIFHLTEMQKNQFMRSERVAVPDTCALLENTQLITVLCEDYSRVVIPDVVVEELTNIKNNKGNKYGNRARRAWEVLSSIAHGEECIESRPSDRSEKVNDKRIIAVAVRAAEEFGCPVDIVTNDIDFAASIRGDGAVHALHLPAYMSGRQGFVNMRKLEELRNDYPESYEGRSPISREEANAYLQDGYTLIIAAVRDKKHSFALRRAKIEWLIACGADVDLRDGGRYGFPPLTHAVQTGDYDMFLYLLRECKAGPNVGSKAIGRADKFRQKNEGNMPLMVAAWEGKTIMVKALCKDPRISLNQQDANGYTALIKACFWGFTDCRDILLAHDADPKIVDYEGKTAEDRYNDSLGGLHRKKRGRVYSVLHRGG